MHILYFIVPSADAEEETCDHGNILPIHYPDHVKTMVKCAGTYVCGNTTV